MAIRTLFKVGSKTLTTNNCFLDLLLFHNCYRPRHSASDYHITPFEYRNLEVR